MIHAPLKRIALVFLLVLPWLVVSCSTIPDTNRRSVNFFQDASERKLGLTQFEQIKSKKTISRDNHLNSIIQRVGASLTPVVPLKNPAWEFVLFDDPVPNAFALPGGKVGIHTGLFAIVENEAQLAAAMGHELAHVVARHGGERVTTQILAVVGGVALDQILRNNEASNTERIVTAGGYTAGAGLGLLGFSRSQEMEADELGALYMARAGYDPRESIALWQNFALWRKRQGDNVSPQFLSSHPLDSTRIERLEAYMPRALAEWKKPR
jgi:metalloendopeptidase OMA1, mitochondrial